MYLADFLILCPQIIISNSVYMMNKDIIYLFCYLHFKFVTEVSPLVPFIKQFQIAAGRRHL